MSFILNNGENKWYSPAKIKHFLGKNDEKRAFLSLIIFRTLLYRFEKMEIIVVLLKTELHFDINRSPTIYWC